MSNNKVQCAYCGTENDAGVRFCVKCGSPLPQTQQTLMETAGVDVNLAPGDGNNSNNSSDGQKKKKVTVGCVIGGIAITVVLCVMVALVLRAILSSSTEGSATATPLSSNVTENSPSSGSSPSSSNSSNSSTAPQTFDGMWVENNGASSTSNGMATAAAEVLFRDGRAYFGIHGESADDIYNNVAGAGITGGSRFELIDGYLIIYQEDGTASKYQRDGTTWWAGSSKFTPDDEAGGGNIVNISQ